LLQFVEFFLQVLGLLDCVKGALGERVEFLVVC